MLSTHVRTHYSRGMGTFSQYTTKKGQMQIPDEIADKTITLKDQYFDLKGLSAYSSLGVPTIREHIKLLELPAFKVKGKLLIKMSEFDKWIEGYRQNKAQDLDSLVDGVMKELKA
jgi:hypothetical protein